MPLGTNEVFVSCSVRYLQGCHWEYLRSIPFHSRWTRFCFHAKEAMAITVKGEFAEEMETAETGGCILHIVHFKQEHCHIETLQCNIVLFPTRGYLQGGNTCLSRVPQPTPRDFPKSGRDPVDTCPSQVPQPTLHYFQVSWRIWLHLPLLQLPLRLKDNWNIDQTMVEKLNS